MNAILALLAKLNPGIEKSKLYKIAEYLVLAGLLWSMYSDASNSLNQHKVNRDEQMKGYAVQIGQNHTELYNMKEELKQLQDRVNRLEDIALRRGH